MPPYGVLLETMKPYTTLIDLFTLWPKQEFLKSAAILSRGKASSSQLHLLFGVKIIRMNITWGMAWRSNYSSKVQH